MNFCSQQISASFWYNIEQNFLQCIMCAAGELSAPPGIKVSSTSPNLHATTHLTHSHRWHLVLFSFKFHLFRARSGQVG